MGLKQPRKDSCHGCAVAGDLELTTSPGLVRTSLKRFFHSLTSVSLMGPELPGWAWAGVDIWAGADMVLVRWLTVDGYLVVRCEVTGS